MKQVLSMFRELENEIVKVNVIKSILNTTIFFLIVQIIISIFSLTYIISAVLAIIFFVYNFLKNTNEMKLKLYEENNPEIREMLSTAKDNLDLNNVMMEALLVEVMQKVRKLSSGSLLDTKKVVMKLTLIFALCFLLIFAAPFKIELLKDIGDAIPKMPFYSKVNTYIEGEILTDELGEDESIYGNSHIAKLGNEQLEIQLNPDISKIDLSKVKETEDEQFRVNNYPGDVEAVAGDTSTEELPKESELAKEYNEKLRQIGG